MIISLLIHHFQELKNVQLDFRNDKPLCQPEVQSWQKHQSSYLSRSAIVYGSHRVGKTMIYDCIFYLWKLITDASAFKLVSSDIEMEFMINKHTYKYCVKTDKNRIINDRIFEDGIEQKQKNKSKLLDFIKSLWLQQFLFIDSSYEYPKDNVELIQIINDNIEEINKCIKEYANEIWWCNIDYPDLFLSVDVNGNIMMNISTKTIRICDLQKSTLELLSLLPTIYKFINSKESHILVIDDITYIAKGRLLSIIRDEYINHLSLMKCHQLIAFTNEYDNTKFGYLCKQINLGHLLI